ncbi:MAG: Npun_R2821/Npun_R2822 family protein [Spirulinaceae cyanobacterium]
MTQGIYTLANDVVYDQLVALLNSIAVNVGAEFPVRVVAFDERLDKVRSEVEKRKNVELVEDPSLFVPWEEFSGEVWQTHPYALKMWREKGIEGVNRLACNRRYFAFDERSDFDQFIYFDADVLVLNSLDFMFEKLGDYDFVIYDFQYKDPGHIFNLDSPRLFEVFPEEKVRSEIFCSGCFGAKKGIFPPEKRAWLIEQLKQNEAEVLYLNAPNQSVLNYMRMRGEIPLCNLSFTLPQEEVTGCAVTSTHFEQRDNLLYDKEARVTFLHYIGVSSKAFTRLCQGENLEVAYRDIFLHYRYLHEPQNRPQFTGKPQPINPPPSFQTKVLKKLGLKK